MLNNSQSSQPQANYKGDLALLSSLGFSKDEIAYADTTLGQYFTTQDLSAFKPDQIRWLASLFQHLANANKAHGSLIKAYSFINEAEQVYKKANINDTYDVANNHFVKASMCLNLQDYSTDIEHHFDEVDRICKLLGNDPEAKSLMVQNLFTRGDFYNKMDEDDKALEFFHKVVENADQLVGEVLPNLLIPTYEELGKIYKSREDVDKTVEFWTKGLELAIKHHGENSSEVFFFYCDLAEFLFLHKRPQEALPYANKGVEVALKFYPANHPEIAWSYYLLGNVLTANSAPAKALDSYKAAIKIYEMSPQGHLDTLSDIYFQAAMIDHDLKNSQEASLFLGRSAQMLEMSHVPNMVGTLMDRAGKLQQHNLWKEYEIYLKTARNACKNFQPQDKQTIAEIDSLLEKLASQKQESPTKKSSGFGKCFGK